MVVVVVGCVAGRSQAGGDDAFGRARKQPVGNRNIEAVSQGASNIQHHHSSNMIHLKDNVSGRQITQINIFSFLENRGICDIIAAP